MACSFCGLSGHFINTCDHQGIGQLYENIKAFYIEIITNFASRDEVLRETEFRRHLHRNFNTIQLRAVAIRYAHAIITNRTIKHELIEWLLEYFKARIINPLTDEETTSSPRTVRWIIDRTPVAPSIFEEFLIGLNLVAEFKKINNIKLFQVKPKEGDTEEEHECAICYDSIKCVELVTLNCKHEFCGKCVKEQINGVSPKCAFCRETMTSIVTKQDTSYNLLATYCLECE